MSKKADSVVERSRNDFDYQTNVTSTLIIRQMSLRLRSVTTLFRHPLFLFYRKEGMSKKADSVVERSRNDIDYQTNVTVRSRNDFDYQTNVTSTSLSDHAF